jgi:hypothetical protein
MLLGTIWAGVRNRREAHLGLALTTVLLLALAIVQAEMFGRGFAFPEVPLLVHLVAAFSALVSLPGVVWSGLCLWKKQDARYLHVRWVALFVFLTVASVGTAVWMFLGAVPVVS